MLCLYGRVGLVHWVLPKPCVPVSDLSAPVLMVGEKIISTNNTLLIHSKIRVADAVLCWNYNFFPGNPPEDFCCKVAFLRDCLRQNALSLWQGWLGPLGLAETMCSLVWTCPYQHAMVGEKIISTNNTLLIHSKIRVADAVLCWNYNFFPGNPPEDFCCKVAFLRDCLRQNALSLWQGWLGPLGLAETMCSLVWTCPYQHAMVGEKQFQKCIFL